MGLLKPKQVCYEILDKLFAEVECFVCWPRVADKGDKAQLGAPR